MKKLEVFPSSEANYEKLRKLFPEGPASRYFYQYELTDAEMNYLLKNPFLRVLKLWKKKGRSGLSLFTLAGIAGVSVQRVKKELEEVGVEPGYCGSTGLPVYSYSWPTYKDFVDSYAEEREERLLAAYGKAWRTWATRFFHVPGYPGVIGEQLWHDLRRAYFLKPRLAKKTDFKPLPAALLKKRWEETQGMEREMTAW